MFNIYNISGKKSHADEKVLFTNHRKLDYSTTHARFFGFCIKGQNPMVY